MQCNAAPRQTLHVRHWRRVINRRAMILVLLKNGEDAGRGLVSGSSGAHRGHADEYPVAIHVGALLIDADDHDHRSVLHGVTEPDVLAELEVSARHIGGA